VLAYIRRAMPYDDAKSLSNDELYAVTAYLLHLNGLVGLDDALDARSLPKIRMPNRDGFVRFKRGD
jgi:cytochrome c